MASVSDRLKSLGVQLGARNIQPPAERPGSWAIEKVVAGLDYPTPLGTTFLTESKFGQEYRHGIIEIFNHPGLTILAEWGRTPGIQQSSASQIAFIDTETSGLAGGTGTYAFLVGLGFFKDDSFHVMQFFMRDPGMEPALLAALADWMSAFQAIVTFNGKSFDLPLLKTRYVLNGLPYPFEKVEHLDLLHLARRLWRNRLESRAMGDLERTILGFTRDQEEVPGYLIPEYYFNYLRTGDARPLEGVFYHNTIDIVSLAALFNYMGTILESPGSADLPSLDIAAIAKLYEDGGRLEDAASLYEASLAMGLPEQFFIRTLERFAFLRRKQGKLELAAGLWQKAAQYGDLAAFVELAKYFEHNKRDIASALEWSTKGFEEAHHQHLPRYQIQIWEEEFQKRIARLTIKLQKGV